MVGGSDGRETSKDVMESAEKLLCEGGEDFDSTF